MTEEHRLNLYLEKYGGRYITGQILFRLVWSNELFEHRKGLFRDYDEMTGSLIREVFDTRLVRKYNYINNRWILEKWAPGNLTKSDEIPGTESGDYIPVYVFEGKNGEYLPPTEKVLKFILDFANGRVKKEDPKSDEYFEDKEVEAQMSMMQDHPDFRTSGPTRNSIAYTKGVKDVT